MGDDGIGPYVIEKLQEKHPDWEFLELHTPGYTILSYIQEKKSLILVDAADFGGKPGEIRRVKREQVQSIKEPCSLNLHGADILTVLENAPSWGIFIDNVILYCIQIESIHPGHSLSHLLKASAIEVISSIERDMLNFRMQAIS